MTGKYRIYDDGPKGRGTLKNLGNWVEQSLQCVRKRPLVQKSESGKNILKYLTVIWRNLKARRQERSS